MGVITGIGKASFMFVMMLWIVSTIVMLAFLIAGITPDTLLQMTAGPFYNVLLHIAENSVGSTSTPVKAITMSGLAIINLFNSLSVLYPSLLYGLATMFGLAPLAPLAALIGMFLQFSAWWYLLNRISLVPDI